MNSRWSVVSKCPDGEPFGWREAMVACRSLGFTTGALTLVGDSSPFPAPYFAPGLIDEIVCDGSDSSLSKCNIEVKDYSFSFDTVGDYVRGSVALICTTPSGEFPCLLEIAYLGLSALMVDWGCSE